MGRPEERADQGRVQGTYWNFCGNDNCEATRFIDRFLDLW